MIKKLLKVAGVAALFFISPFSFGQTPLLQFDGVDDFVNLGTNAGNNVRTFEMWFSPNNTITNSNTTRQTLIGREVSLSTNADEFQIYFWPGSGNLRFNITNNAGTSFQTQSTTTTWNAGQWYHVAVVIDFSGMRMYIDGLLEGTNGGFNAATATRTAANEFTALGCWGSFNQRFFRGRIEDVRLSSDVLYTANFDLVCPDIQPHPSSTGCWNFNDPSGTTTADSSPGGNTATLENGVTWTEDLICENECTCDAKVSLSPLTSLSTSGNQSHSLFIDTQGELIKELVIELPYFVSLVDEACLACDPATVTSNGTILGGQPIAGTPGILDDPYSLGHSRRIVYTFASPTAVNQSIQLDLKFPPVLDLTCCKNAVEFCLNITTKKDDCTTCEYKVCSKPLTIQKTSSEPLEVRNVPSEDLRLDFSVFPNPASKRVSVNVSNEFFESGQASLITIDGRVVQSKAVNAKQFDFELNNLNPGVYLITLQSGNQKSSKELIVE